MKYDDMYSSLFDLNYTYTILVQRPQNAIDDRS
jgi:hypothetical protein